MKKQNLKPIELDKKNSTLFVGNGINQLFSYKSCQKLIEEEMLENNVNFSFDKIENIPFNMQIIASSNDNVDKSMKRLAEKLNFEISFKQKEFLQKLLSFDFSAILTANYTTEIEQALGLKNDKYSFFKSRLCTENLTDKMRKSHLYVASQVENKTIWHIHGDIYAPSLITMGNYYYGKQISQIEQYISSIIKKCAIAKSQGSSYTPKTWVDYFMLTDVYMLGFGMDFSESDIWYLVCAKKRHFPNTKIYYYIPKEEATEKEALMILLRAYDVVVVDDFSIGEDKNYMNFYNNAVLDISQRCVKTQPVLV